MDHDLFSCNVTSSFLDDLSEISQEPAVNICNYSPQTNRLATSNNNNNPHGYNRELCPSQISSTMNYYPLAPHNCNYAPLSRSSNVYGYGYNPCSSYSDYGASIGPGTPHHSLHSLHSTMPYSTTMANDARLAAAAGAVEMRYDTDTITHRHGNNNNNNSLANNYLDNNHSLRKSSLSNNYLDNKFANFPKYPPPISKTNYPPNPMYRSSEMSGASGGPGHCDGVGVNYQCPPAYFPNGGAAPSVYYEHHAIASSSSCSSSSSSSASCSSSSVSHFEERQKPDRVAVQNLASIDQNIFSLESKLHFLTSSSHNLASNPNVIHEINEIKDKLIYLNQLKDKYLLSRSGVNKFHLAVGNKPEFCDNKDISGQKALGNYNTAIRQSDVYSNCQTSSNLSPFYSTGNANKPLDGYSYNFLPNTNANMQSLGEKYQPIEPVDVERPFPHSALDGSNSTHKSFISDLTGSDFSPACVAVNKQHSARDELSTPPISEFTDLTAMIPLKSCHNKPAVVPDTKEPAIEPLSTRSGHEIRVCQSVDKHDFPDTSIETRTDESDTLACADNDVQSICDREIDTQVTLATRESIVDAVAVPDEQEEYVPNLQSVTADTDEPGFSDCVSNVPAENPVLSTENIDCDLSDDIDDQRQSNPVAERCVDAMEPNEDAMPKLEVLESNAKISLKRPWINKLKFKSSSKKNPIIYKVPKWSFKFKKYYFYLRLKKLHQEYCNSKKLKSRNTESINSSDSKVSKNDDVKKKPMSNACKIAKRMKNVQSFLKKRNSRGSYFNNFDTEDRNMPRKSLRNSAEFHITTRGKKETSFEIDSNDENSINSDDDSNFELNLENQHKVVQKILGSRIVSASDILDVTSKGSEIEFDEYYLKYRGFSYIHCEWKSAETVSDPTFSSKLKRYKNMKINSVDEPDECLFNPDYVEIDRVLACKQIECNKKGEDLSISDSSKETITYYLVKWRSLPYEEITWEKSEDVDPAKVKEYLQRISNAYIENTEAIKPTHKNWKPITGGRVYKNGNVLRDYQLEGVNWLTFCWLTNRNCILADEMGLGKTIQSIAFLIELYNYDFKGPFLIIVPLSTLGNWQREFEQWSNLNVILYHGSAKSRRLIQNYEAVLKNYECSQSNKLLFNAIITTYEVLLSDLLFFSKFQWTASIIDEAHRLKNKRCKLIEGLKMLDLQFRVLLTGTPLQNNVQELFNLLNFLESSKFFCESDFLSQYGNLRSEEQVASLKILLQPMMLRRLKEDVEKSLAPKEEIVVEVELTNIQKKYYRAILERNFTFLSKGVSGNNIPNLMNTMMELRKCCNHPFLIKGAEEAILSNLKSGTDMGNITRFIQNKIIDEETLQFYSMVYSSGKLVLIHKLLPKLKQDGHKVLIFSQMVRVLDILEDYLIYEKYQYERIDGRIHGLLRQEAIDRFTSDPEKFIFLLCTKAGGLGINLTAADVVIIYDSDWNPQNDLQAQARCHRIGQQKLVNVYRLITRNTYEREMFDRASLKLGLDKAILQSMTYTESKPVSQLSKKEIEDLLKLGAYGALMDDDKDGEKFCEEDIDKILLSRSTVVKLNSSERNSSFSKASFSISDNRSDIKLDDPNFWQKWAKKAGVDENEICNSLIMDKPRLRRQTNRYKPNCTLFDEISGDDSNSSVFDSLKVQNHSSNKNLSYSKVKKKNSKGLSSNLMTEIKDNEIDENSYKPTQDMDRYDLFKAEKCLLQFGWGRWEHALEKISFKVPVSPKELELLCRTILHYAHRHYSGDDRIFSFIEDLMLPDSDSATMRRHLGYSAPVARGRRGRKGLEEMISAITKKETSDNKILSKKNLETSEDVNNIDEEQSDILTNISTPVSVNGDNSDNSSEFSALVCPNFRKHIQRTSHKLLHRIQFLYFLNHEIIGLERAKLILNNSSYMDIPGFPELKLFKYLDNDCLPTWWNITVDKCLLFGIFKHGWEKYDDIYKDPCLGFIDWLAGSNYPSCFDKESSDVKNHQNTENNSNANLSRSLEDSDSLNQNNLEMSTENDRKNDIPTNAELNIRLRKIIGSFQKLWRQKESEKNKVKTTFQSFESNLVSSEITNHTSNDGKTTKWSRREETEFYRAINSYGIEKLPDSDEFVWGNFRNVCNLPRKSNESLSEYFKAFYTMCQKICQKYPLLYNDHHTIEVENISTERASRCLMKINLISKIRNEILVHPDLEERIKLCECTNDFPSWWISGYHDLSILKGISKYGATRTELSIISDQNLGFRQTIIDLLKQQSNNQSNSDDKNCPSELAKSTSVSLTSSSHVIEKSESTEENVETSNDNEINVDHSLDLLLDKARELISIDIFDSFIEDIVNEFVGTITNHNNESDIILPEQSSAETPFDISVLAKIGWPKERILFSRLELLIQTVEKGEWPFSKNQNVPLMEDREPLSESLNGNSENPDTSIFNSSETIKSEHQLSNFKSKRRGRKRTVTQFMPSNSLNETHKNELVNIEESPIAEEPNSQTAYNPWNTALNFSLSSDPAFFMQKMLQMTPEINSGLSTPIAQGMETSNPSRISSSNNGLNLSSLYKVKSTTNSSSTDSSVWSISQSSLKNSKNSVRRGRRPKHTGPYEMARDSKRDSTSTMNMFNNRSLNNRPICDNPSSNPDTIIPVINIFNGTLIYDETAPKRKNLESFLIHNANFMPYSVEEEDQKIFNKVAKSRGQETGPLEAMIFTQYMNFMMSTMLASQAPLNLYNSFLLANEGSKSSLTEEQLNASSLYMEQYQDSILSMLGVAGHSVGGLDFKSTGNNEEVTKSKKRSTSPIRNTGIPVKVKSYSISHLTDNDNIGTPEENKTPAHSNLSTSIGIGEKSEGKSTYLSSSTPNFSNTSNKLTSCDSSNKLHMSNQNADILASYQAYLYSAMLYSDYISSMQQYSLINNKTNNIPDINNFKHPQRNKTNENFSSNNNNQTHVTSSSSIPVESGLPCESKSVKKNKVSSFSVESMGITPIDSSVKVSSTELNTTSHTSSQDVGDDYAVLDLSNR